MDNPDEKKKNYKYMEQRRRDIRDCKQIKIYNKNKSKKEKRKQKDPEWAASRLAKTIAYNERQKAVPVEPIENTKKVAFDSAQVIQFEDTVCEAVAVGTVKLAAKMPPPYEMTTKRPPDKFDENGMLLPILGNVFMPFPNNHPVFLSAKTSTDKSSYLDELPKRPKKQKRASDQDSGEEEFDINFKSNSDEPNFEYPGDEGASEHTKRLKKGTQNLVVKVNVELLKKLFSVFPKKLNGRKESVLYEKTYGSILNAFKKNRQWKKPAIKKLVDTFEYVIRKKLGLESDELHFAFAFMKSQTGKRQRPHKDFTNDELKKGFDHKAWVGFLPLTKQGQQLEIWPEQKNEEQKSGEIVSIDYGRMLLLKGGVVHAGGFQQEDKFVYERMMIYISKMAIPVSAMSNIYNKKGNDLFITHKHSEIEVSK